jgi:alpha-1,3-rhamnosyltransferase
MQPLISVITPCYNHAHTLPDYFTGLLAQTYRNLELIVIDDCSTDASWDVMQHYRPQCEAAFARVVLLRNERNLGLIGTMARLQEHITGEFVSPLESDDVFYPTKLEANVAYLREHPEMGAVHSDIDFLLPDGTLEQARWKSRDRHIASGEVYESLLFDNCILTCAFMCRADLFRQYADYSRYAASGYHTADYPLFLDLARHTRIGYLDQVLALYRVVPGSISHPGDPVQALRWKAAYYQVKMDAMTRYGEPSADVRDRALWQYYRALFDLGFAAGSDAEFWRGYDWLRAHHPVEAGRWGNRVRALAMKIRLLRLLVRWIETARLRRDPDDPPSLKHR